MTKKVFNMEGGLHSAAAYSAFENRAYGNCVASTDSFVVTAGTGMNARISAGDGLIDTGLNFARRIQSDAQETVAIAAASTSYNRIDTVVAYIDTAVTPTTSVVDNTNGILKFASIAGVAASSPQAPNQAAIQSAIGAGKPYMVLYNITVPTNATNLSSATITDRRKVITVLNPAQIPAKTITSGMIGDGEVKPHNLAVGIAFKGTRTTNYNIDNASPHLVMNNITYNYGGGYDGTTFTAPISGIYNFSASIYVEGAGTSATRAFIQTADIIGNTDIASAMTMDMNATRMRKAMGVWEGYMQAGASIKFRAYCDAVANINNPITYLAGHLVTRV